MIHVRRTIRKAVADALVAASTSAGSRVYSNPVAPRVTFPALTVDDAGEQQRAMTMPGGAGRTIERVFGLLVSAEVQQVSGYADARDDLLASVEAALAGASLPGVKAIVPTGTFFDVDGEGERPVAVGRQRFEITYYTTQGNPAATI